MDALQEMRTNMTKIAIVGLGYVGMPLALAFAKHVEVVGFDIDERKVEQYRKGIDPTGEVEREALRNTTARFTSKETEIASANFIIVAVPTPTKPDNTPDLGAIKGASVIVGRNLRKGATVVFESTVYPGATEDVCIPILERESGLLCGQDFKVGYSPERINPADKIHRLENIVKIVSGTDDDALERIASVYELVVQAGVFRASCIKVAEAAKVAENSQRDINIAFVNELAMAFNRMGIDTNEVIDAMNTKWNALRFRPGLVGGHCIGVDPYYFIYKAAGVGYQSQIVSQGRLVNERMTEFVGESIITQLTSAGIDLSSARVAVFGVTFKENCPDIRNSKVIEVIGYLRGYGIHSMVVDPFADPAETKKEYGIELMTIDQISNVDCIVIAVAHQCFCDMPLDDLVRLYRDCNAKHKVLIDVKGIRSRAELDAAGLRYWRV